MKRIILALAIAGLSFSASALPPPGASVPLNVNIANQPIDVAPITEVTELASVVTFTDRAWVEPGTNGAESMVAATDLLLRGVSLSVDASVSSKNALVCLGRVSVLPPDDEWTKITVMYINVMSGARESRYQPVNNLRIPQGSTLQVTFTNATDTTCQVVWYADLIQMP